MGVATRIALTVNFFTLPLPLVIFSLGTILGIGGLNTSVKSLGSSGNVADMSGSGPGC